ncbi:MAG: hypothetical protein WAU70_17060 [Flavobacteriales bacterium]
MKAEHANARWLVVVLVAGHMALLAAYTLPGIWVPTRLRFWSQAYTRVLFHQDWRLFAPEPPACGCAVQVKGSEDTEWVDLNSVHSHFLWERMCSNACRYAEVGLAAGDSAVVAPVPLTVSLERMAEAVPRKGLLEARLLRDGASRERIAIELTTH